MDQFRAPRFEGIGVTTRKRRSQVSRRSIPEAQPLSDRSPMPSTPLSDDMSKVSSDENNGDANSKGKMFNLNQCISRGFPASGSDGGSNVLFSNGVLRAAMANDGKPKKVMLKVGGVTHTIQNKSSSNGASSGGSSAKIDQLSNIGQENSYHDHSTSLEKKSRLQGIPWKDFPQGGFSLEKEDIKSMPAKNAFEKQGEKLEPVCKSKRAPKRRVLDEGFDEDDDAEIRYLEKLKNAKVGGYKYLGAKSTKNQHSLSRVYEKSNSEIVLEDTDYEEDELLSDDEPEGKKKKIQKKDLSNSQTESKREMTLTTRQQALLSSMDASSSGMSKIEFPDGLPPPPPRKQKEILSAVEQQTKKAEASQRRKIHNEKVARELEAEAIRKILSQDSTRKKREDKMKKRREELAQEKVANAKTLASNTIRWTMGSAGTIVTFPEDMGLPKIFDSKPSAILLHTKSVLALLVQILTSTGIPSRSFLFAVSNATRKFMKKCNLRRPAKIVVSPLLSFMQLFLHNYVNI